MTMKNKIITNADESALIEHSGIAAMDRRNIARRNRLAGIAITILLGAAVYLFLKLHL